MKEYLLLFRGGDSRTLQQSPEKWQAHMQKWGQWMSALKDQGKFIGAQPLGNSGKTVSGINKVVSDGPFMEGKELIGGYLSRKADTFDEAVAISKGCPILEFDSGTVEVREIKQMGM